jgi:hypothetical protein
MAKCPVCSKKIAVRLFEPFYAKCYVFCSCGALLKARYWLLWDVIGYGVFFSIIYTAVLLADRFNVPTKIILLAAITFLFFFWSLVFFQFARFMVVKRVEPEAEGIT